MVAKAVCNLFEGLKNSEKIRERFDVLIHQYYVFMRSNESREKEESFLRDLMDFTDYFTTLLDDFLRGNSFQLY